MTGMQCGRAGPGRQPAPDRKSWIPAFAGMTLLATALASVAALVVSALVSPARADIGSVPDRSRQQELSRLVRQECGFCHGLRLTGGLGSPLTAEALQDRPAEAMVATILYGRGGTAMPGWAPFISESEAGWIVEQLQKGVME